MAARGDPLRKYPVANKTTPCGMNFPRIRFKRNSAPEARYSPNSMVDAVPRTQVVTQSASRRRGTRGVTALRAGDAWPCKALLGGIVTCVAPDDGVLGRRVDGVVGKMSCPSAVMMVV